MPMSVPMIIEIAVAENATSSDARDPQTSCASTSMPRESVPSRNSPFGAWFGVLFVCVTSSMLAGNMTGARNASATAITITTRPRMPEGWRRNSLQKEPS